MFILDSTHHSKIYMRVCVLEISFKRCWLLQVFLVLFDRIDEIIKAYLFVCLCVNNQRSSLTFLLDVPEKGTRLARLEFASLAMDVGATQCHGVVAATPSTTTTIPTHVHLPNLLRIDVDQR